MDTDKNAGVNHDIPPLTQSRMRKGGVNILQPTTQRPPRPGGSGGPKCEACGLHHPRRTECTIDG